MIPKDDVDGYSDNQVIKLPNGWTARVRVEPDEDMGAPWEEHDGHGEVRHVRYSRGHHPVKRPGERVMRVDGYDVWLYDFADAIRTARKDGWGCSHGVHPSEKQYHATEREMRACAVEQDFQHMRGWLNNEWQWIGVIVTLLDAEGDEVESDSLWGIESDGDYWREVAAEMVNDLAAGVVLPSAC